MYHDSGSIDLFRFCVRDKDSVFLLAADCKAQWGTDASLTKNHIKVYRGLEQRTCQFHG